MFPFSGTEVSSSGRNCQSDQKWMAKKKERKRKYKSTEFCLLQISFRNKPFTKYCDGITSYLQATPQFGWLFELFLHHWYYSGKRKSTPPGILRRFLKHYSTTCGGARKLRGSSLRGVQRRRFLNELWSTDAAGYALVDMGLYNTVRGDGLHKEGQRTAFLRTLVNRPISSYCKIRSNGHWHY